MKKQIDFHELFDLDLKNGTLYWKKRLSQRAKIGDKAGFLDENGYYIVGIKGKKYPVHRIIWQLINGKEPLKIDHINGDRSDNRFCNLREVTHRENTQNKKCHREGKLVGVTYRPINKNNKWQAQIQIEGKRIYLGCFPTQIQAHHAYLSALEKGKREGKISTLT
jgi:hypothetical protein